jgi:hypothetical protein
MSKNIVLDDLIEELYGLGGNASMSHFRSLNSPFQGSGLNRQHTPSKKPSIGNECGHKLYPWQREVYNRYRQGRKDAIISVPPAAGKTAPVLCAWKAEFISFLAKYANGDKNIKVPRIAFIVPTQQLASQIAGQDFLRNSDFGLLRMVAEEPELFRPLIGHRFATNRGNNRVTSRDPVTGKQLYQGDAYYDPNVGPQQPIGSNRRITRQMEPELLPLTQNDINEINKIVSTEFVGVLYGGLGASDARPSSTTGIFGSLKPILVGTYQPMANLIKKHKGSFDIVAIDETQQFIGEPGKDKVDKDMQEKQRAFLDIIKYTPRSASLFLMTGSVNNKTVEDIRDLINKYFKRDLVKIPKQIPPNAKVAADEGQANRSQINVAAYDKMQNKDQMITLCKSLITRRQTNSIILVFSVKRQTANGVFRIIEDMVAGKDGGKLPIINREFMATQIGSKIDVDRDRKFFENKKELNRKIFQLKAGLRDMKALSTSDRNAMEDILDDLIMKKEISEVKTAEFEIDILEKKIEDIVKGNGRDAEFEGLKDKIADIRKGFRNEMASHYQIDTDNHDIKNVDQYDNYLKSQKQGMTVKQLADRESGNYISPDIPVAIRDDSPEVSDIELLKYFDIRSVEQKPFKNKLLPKADPNNLLYQAALRGIGVMTGSLPQRIKETIQKLFKSGKLPIMFATDALGVGANVDVKHLYIPRLMKPPEFLPIDDSSLVQLINRAGRKGSGKFTVAYVYCSSGDYERVKDFIEHDPRITVKMISDLPFGNLVELAKEKGVSFASDLTYRLFSNNDK